VLPINRISSPGEKLLVHPYLSTHRTDIDSLCLEVSLTQSLTNEYPFLNYQRRPASGKPQNIIAPTHPQFEMTIHCPQRTQPAYATRPVAHQLSRPDCTASPVVATPSREASPVAIREPDPPVLCIQPHHLRLSSM
jgi:hypothetical protein